MKYTLEHLKKHPEKKIKFSNQQVLIWSGQWKRWWRVGASGYTDDITEAGTFDFNEAWRISSHCGPEKKIVYHTFIEKMIIVKTRVVVA